MTGSTVTNFAMGGSVMSESEAKSERILNCVDYAAMMASKGNASKENDSKASTLCYIESPPEYPSIPDLRDESEPQETSLKISEIYAEPTMQSEKVYKTMNDSMSLLQATKSQILKIFEEKQNQLKIQAQNERPNDATAKILDSVEKRRKQLLTEAIHKIRAHVDDLEQVSRMF